jgi:hypothetical protein
MIRLAGAEISNAQATSVAFRSDYGVRSSALRNSGRSTLEGTSKQFMGYITVTIDPPNDLNVVRSRSRNSYSYRPNKSPTSGVNHATRPGDPTTVCGLECDGMHLFPEIPFTERALACGSCLSNLARR